MVHQEGFEPTTLGSEDRCSIQLSYWCEECAPECSSLSEQSEDKLRNKGHLN